MTQHPNNPQSNHTGTAPHEQSDFDETANGDFLSSLVNETLENTRSRKRTWSVLAVVAIAAVVAVGATVAWITAQTEPITNTFTYGNIDIELTETDTKLDNDSKDTTNQYKLMPGEAVTKDPVVTVKEGSEACWLFVKLDKSNYFDDYLEYTRADGWIQLQDNEDTPNDIDGVFYREVGAATASGDVKYHVLAEDKVTARENADVNSLLENATWPTLTVTAYAVQHTGFDSAYEAWSVFEPRQTP